MLTQQQNQRIKEAQGLTGSAGSIEREGKLKKGGKKKMTARTRNMGQNFKTITREKYFETHVKGKTIVPPLGHYKTRFDQIEAKVSVPLFGTADRWSGSNA